MRRGRAEVGDPRVWILTRGRQGDLDQMMALSQALGWPTAVKRLVFHKPHVPALARALLKAESDPLTPPWPDLVICAEALPSIMARHLKRQSGGRIRIVCAGRPAGDPADFDLVLTSAQFRLPPAANIVTLSMPLTAAMDARPARALPEDFVRPLIVLVAGGSSFPDRLDGAAATALAQQVLEYAGQRQGTAWAFTSPRTSPDAAAAIAGAFAPPHRVHLYDKDNHVYRAALAMADLIIVTSDSVSMTADALATGKAVQVYGLPQTRNLEWRFTEWLHRHAILEPSLLSMPLRWLLKAAVLEVSADRRLLFEALAAQHRLIWFGEEPVACPSTIPDDLRLAVERVRALFPRKHTEAIDRPAAD